MDRVGTPVADPPASTPSQKSKSRRWMVLLAIIAILGITGAIGYFVVLPRIQQTSPSSTLQTFCDGYKNLDAQKVYGTLSSQAQATSSEASIAAGFSTVKNVGVKVSECTVSNVQVNGSKATATITLTFVGSASGQTQSQTQREPVSLVLENGTWKISEMQTS